MAVIVETIDQVWLRISSSGSEWGESATSFREIYEQAVDWTLKTLVIMFRSL